MECLIDFTSILKFKTRFIILKLWVNSQAANNLIWESASFGRRCPTYIIRRKKVIRYLVDAGFSDTFSFRDTIYINCEPRQTSIFWSRLLAGWFLIVSIFQIGNNNPQYSVRFMGKQRKRIRSIMPLDASANTFCSLSRYMTNCRH